jgi:hypothetical protein
VLPVFSSHQGNALLKSLLLGSVVPENEIVEFKWVSYSYTSAWEDIKHEFEHVMWEQGIITIIFTDKCCDEVG